MVGSFLLQLLLYTYMMKFYSGIEAYVCTFNMIAKDMAAIIGLLYSLVIGGLDAKAAMNSLNDCFITTMHHRCRSMFP